MRLVINGHFVGFAVSSRLPDGESRYLYASSRENTFMSRALTRRETAFNGRQYLHSGVEGTAHRQALPEHQKYDNITPGSQKEGPGQFCLCFWRDHAQNSLDRIQPGAIVGLPLTISLGGTITAALAEAKQEPKEKRADEMMLWG